MMQVCTNTMNNKNQILLFDNFILDYVKTFFWTFHWDLFSQGYDLLGLIIIILLLVMIPLLFNFFWVVK